MASGCQIDKLISAVANPAGPIMDSVRRFPQILSSSLCSHQIHPCSDGCALMDACRLPTSVVQHGPGRRQAGLFVQLQKERCTRLINHLTVGDLSGYQDDCALASR